MKKIFPTLSMRKGLLLAVLLLVLTLTVTLCACNIVIQDKKTSDTTVITLDAPRNVTITDDDLVTWDAVTDAAGYILFVGDDQYPVTTNMYDLKQLGLQKGNYIITVQAVTKAKGYKDSASSTAVLYEYQGVVYTLQVISEEGGTTNISKKTYSANEVVDLNAYPKEDYHFDGWFSDNYYKISGNSDFSFKINSDTIIYAQFSPDPEKLEKSAAYESELMKCAEDFAVVVYCAEADSVSYIKNNFFIYDDYFLNQAGEVESGYEEFAERKIGRIDSRGNNLYVITPAEEYKKSGSYLARATGNVSILKEYSRIINSNNGLASAEDLDDISTLADDQGTEELSFSIDNTPHVDMRLNDDVYIYSYKGNRNANDDNVDGWIVESVGNGLTDEETGVIGGFITENIKVRGNHTLQVGDVVGFGGGITKNISIEQFDDNTVFGRIKSITYCGGETVYPVIFVELIPVERTPTSSTPWTFIKKARSTSPIISKNTPKN